MKIFTHTLSRLLLLVFLASISLGAAAETRTRGYIEQDFGNGLVGGVYYNSGRPGHDPRPYDHRHHHPEPPKKHKHKKDKHHDKRHHDKHHHNCYDRHCYYCRGHRR